MYQAEPPETFGSYLRYRVCLSPKVVDAAIKVTAQPVEVNTDAAGQTVAPARH